MPSKNVLKIYAPDAFYWVGSKGLNNQTIFSDDEDYRQFIALLQRHLSHEHAEDRLGRRYEKLYQKIEVVAYCLVPNAFQMLIYQYDPDGLPGLMRRVLTSYTMYYNRKHGRSGSLFQSRYKAALLTEPMDILKVSRYIHLMPTNLGQDIHAYAYTSLPVILGQQHAEWLRPERLLAIGNKEQIDYHAYMANYPEYSAEMDLLRLKLGDK